MPNINSSNHGKLRELTFLIEPGTWIFPTVLSVFLVVVSRYNFLLFHTLAELFAVAVAIIMFVVALNTYAFSRNHYLMFLSCGYFWVSTLDLAHALVYKGMGIFPISGGNVSAQFWIVNRYFEAVVLFVAPFFLTRSVKRGILFSLFGAVAALFYALIITGKMPDTFVEGLGLTRFKVISEYAIIAILGGGLGHLVLRRSFLDPRILGPVALSIILTMGAELAFTFYVSVYGLSNLVGHILKLFSFWLIYQAIIRTTLAEPFKILARGASSFDAVPESTIIVGHDGIIRQVNKAACGMSSIHEDVLVGSSCHDIFHPNVLDWEECPLCTHIQEGRTLDVSEFYFSGSGRWVEISLSPFEAPGVMGGLVQVSRDITKRKHTEADWKKLSATFQGILDHMPTIFIKIDRNGRISESRGAGMWRLGLENGEEVGANAFEKYPNAVQGFRRALSGEMVDMEINGYSINAPWSFQMFLAPDEATGGITGFWIDITERKNAEQALRSSEERFRMAISGSTSGIWDWDLITNDEYFSPRWKEILGYEDHELENRLETFNDALHPDDAERVKDALLAHFYRQVPYDIEFRLRHKGGHYVWVHSRGHAIWDRNGKPIRMAGATTDISGRKETEEKLLREKERTERYLNIAGTMILALDRNGKVTLINDKGCDVLGYDKGEVIGKDWFKLAVPPEERKEIRRHFKKVISGGQDLSEYFENDILTRSGERRLIAWHNTKMIDENGVVTGTLSSALDVTERKEAEEKIRTLSLAVEQSPSMVVITDIKGGVEYVNPKFEEVTEYQLIEIIGKNLRILKTGYTKPEEYVRMWKALTAGEEWHCEFRNRKKSGKEYWDLSSITPIKGADGRITHYLAVKEDITERKLTEETLRQAQKMEGIGHLTGGIAHDFNNLLGIIIGNLEILEEDLEGNKEFVEQAEAAKRAALRGADLIKRLLSFSRQEPTRSNPVNVNDIIIGMHGFLLKSLTKEIDIKVDLSDDIWLTDIDSGDFETTLVNLAVNARDAMPGGGILQIESRNKIFKKGDAGLLPDMAPGSYVMISVRDNGHGMPEETFGMIFDPFFTTKDKSKGTGLGLSMVYGFVSRSRGQIGVESELGRGTVFHLYLPKSTAVEVKEIPVIKPQEDLPRGDETILVVDDEPELAGLVVSILEPLGYRTLVAEDGPKAMEVLKSKGPEIDLLFTDVVMPGGMNGFELASHAKELLSDLKVIIASGYPLNQEMRNDDEGGGPHQTMLAKPFGRSALSIAIRQALDE